MRQTRFTEGFLEGSRECCVEGSKKGSFLWGGILRRGSQKGGFKRSQKAETRLSESPTPFACALCMHIAEDFLGVTSNVREWLSMASAPSLNYAQKRQVTSSV